MHTPIVSFVIPCYKLGHFLGDCIESVLSQTYRDLEVLIMDDCSPDNAQAVAGSFQDPRVRYIRNKRNLGHLANYNKGIGLSRGRYVWLISADDRLRRPYVLKRYVHLMDEQPRVGYICCPGIGLEDGVETTVLDCGYYGTRDKIFSGRDFIAASIRKGYGLLAPSVMVRKDCYDKISLFPLDMPHQGDMYLWFRWALEYDVAYLCEPMVNYRLHDLNIMKDLLSKRPDAVLKDEVTVLWRTREFCRQKGLVALADKCEHAVTSKYARAAVAAMYDDMYAHCSMSIVQCEEALLANASSVAEFGRFRGEFYAYMANAHWRHSGFEHAKQSYARALRENWRTPDVWLKIFCLFAGLGRTGLFINHAKERLGDSIERLRALNSHRRAPHGAGIENINGEERIRQPRSCLGCFNGQHSL